MVLAVGLSPHYEVNRPPIVDMDNYTSVVAIVLMVSIVLITTILFVLLTWLNGLYITRCISQCHYEIWSNVPGCRTKKGMVDYL